MLGDFFMATLLGILVALSVYSIFYLLLAVGMYRRWRRAQRGGK